MGRSLSVLLYRITVLAGSALLIGGNELMLLADELALRLASAPTPRTVLACLSCWALYHALGRLLRLLRSLRVHIRLEPW